MIFGSILRRVLPEQTVAKIDYHLHPEMRDLWGGAFNGQCGRQQIFIDLLAAFRFTHIVETGTFRGTTTEFLARESGLPVFTVEANAKSHEFARLRLKQRPSVRLFAGDSRIFLRRLIPVIPPATSRPFFYLDAHWEENLPLREEVEIIFSAYSESVIMIDDFEVPDDPGYTFDNYGEGKVLTGSYLAAVVQAFDAIVAYPSVPSSRESGSKRGCAVLVSPRLRDLLSRVPSLREA